MSGTNDGSSRPLGPGVSPGSVLSSDCLVSTGSPFSSDSVFSSASLVSSGSLDSSGPLVSSAPLRYEDQIIRRDLTITYQPAKSPQYTAMKRIDLTSATPWFRQLQTGFYATLGRDPINAKDDGTMADKPYCLGLLLSKHFHAGAYLDAEVLITTLNAADLSATHLRKRVEQMTRNITERRPVGVIVQQGSMKQGHGFALFPCTGLPGDADSWPLAWFLPTLMFCIPTDTAGGQNYWAVRMEKIDLAETSWWANPAHALPPPIEYRDYSTKTEVGICTACNTESLQIFSKGFVCLNPQCSEWFQSGGIKIQPGVDWPYSDRFLQERADQTTPIQGLVPSYPKLYLDIRDFYRLNYEAPITTLIAQQAAGQEIDPASVLDLCSNLMKGLACPLCGTLNSRVRWSEWHCIQEGCDFRLHAPPPMLTPEFLQKCSTSKSELTKWKAFTNMPQGLQSLPGYQETRQVGDYTAHEYKLGDECFLTILKAGARATAMADQIFRVILSQANAGEIPLQRCQHGSRAGKVLLRHFTHNGGAIYKYRTAVPTTSFEESPASVEEAVRYMNEQLKTYFPDSIGTFNQLYFAGYLAEMGMSMHDDGETGLGANVAGLNLGGRGAFSIGIKNNINYGRPVTERRPIQSREALKEQWMTSDPLIVGCAEYEFRKTLKDRLDKKEISQMQWQGLFKERMLAAKSNGKQHVIMRFPLDHGDIVMMHGAKFQSYLLHSAEVSKNIALRIALTFRTVPAVPEEDMEKGKGVKRPRESSGEASQAKRARGVKGG